MKITKGVYCRTFPNGKRYVGIAWGKYGIEDRLKREYNTSFNKNSQDYKNKLSYAIRKYGQPVDTIILETDDIEKMKRVERQMIALWNLTSDKYGYNMTPGGDGNNKKCKKLSPEEKLLRKEKMIEKGTWNACNKNRKGVPRTDEVKNKISEASKNGIKKVDMKKIMKEVSNRPEVREKRSEIAKKNAKFGKNNPRYKPYTIKNILTNEVFTGGTVEILNIKNVRVSNILKYGKSKNWITLEKKENI
jgi:hypothetical protein